jgi:hypothetical protein
MATEQNPLAPIAQPASDVVCVALVVDTSLIVRDEWQHVLQQYVNPLLTRLNDLYPQQQNQVCLPIVPT